MNWVLLLTVWIIIQMCVRVALQPKRSREKGHDNSQLVGSLVENVLWGVGMIFCLFMIGVYD